MFESTVSAKADLDGLLTRLLHVEAGWQPNSSRVEQLDALERVKAALTAAQVRVTAAFVTEERQVAAEWHARARAAADQDDFAAWRTARDEARRHQVEDASENSPMSARGRRCERVGIAAQIALALRMSPTRGASFVAFADALTYDLPHVLMALETGELSPRRAELVVRETAALGRESRRRVDAEIAGELAGSWGRLGDRELVRHVRAAVYRTDPLFVLGRCRIAESERRVTIRPAPDTMCLVTATLPVAQGVAAYAALTRAADAAKAAGDGRGRGQVMADLLVGRLTGAETVEDLGVEVQVVMTDRALLEGDAEPAQIPGYGVVPAGWARALVSRAGRGNRRNQRARVWVRRLFTHPDDGTLVTMDSRRRTFDGGLRDFLVVRDGACREPWCDAPVRHADHVVEHAAGGPTTVDNAQGLCARGNYTKQQPGWSSRTVPCRPHTVETVTPTGHRYQSQAPPLLPLRLDLTGRPLDRVLTLVLTG